ncbi:MAG TPA: PQQ-binding-like beta-propeller repeat protein [Actinomycetota bacterium]|nr:PQQ-binding-like beta-propeller repeat protein [Actinomycetota bacterium]
MKPETLDRYEGLFAPPERAYDGFLRRRSRKQRNQRIGVFVLAFAIAAGSVAATMAALHRATEPGPANTIDPGNVAQLHEIGNDLTFPQEGFRMATGDGVLVVGTSRFHGQRGQVIAYPFPCGDASLACTPLWRADLDGGGSPVVANGVAYVTGLRGQTLYAFATDCGSDGTRCSPLWTANVGPTSWITPPIVASQGSTSRVFVGTADAVLAFAVGCADGGGTCTPVWEAPVADVPRVLTYADGVLYAGTGKPGAPDPADTGSVVAFDASCPFGSPRLPARCRLWRRSVGQVWDLAVDGGTLLVGTNGGPSGVQAYPIACVRSGGSCRPLWKATTNCCTQLTAANGTVYAEDQTDQAYAFPTSCASDGSRCDPVWTSSAVLGQPFIDFRRPLVSGGLVFVGGDEGWIYSFPENCAGACPPASRTFIPDQNGIPGNWDAVTLNDRLYVAATDGLHVFSAERTSPVAGRASAGGAPLFYLGLALVAGVVLTLRFVRRRPAI